MFSAIQQFLALQGTKYISPAKAGDLSETMLAYKALGQEARQEFTRLAQQFQTLYPNLSLQKVSNWMNQAQVLRPYFWVYLQGVGELSEPMFALRLYGDEADFGISVEVSVIERKKDEESLSKQNRVLTVPVADGMYYFAQIDGVSQRFSGNEDNRQLLLGQVASGQVRKVLVKQDINCSQATSVEGIVQKMQATLENLIPYYEATREI